MINVYNSVINWLNSLGIFTQVSRYKGEFEEGADWNPIFPVCFVRLESAKPQPTDSAGYMLAREYVFSLYVADKNIDAPGVLDKVQQLWNPSIRNAYISDANWIGYYAGVEVYRVELTIVAK